MAIKPIHAVWGALAIVALIGISYAAGQTQPTEAQASGALEITQDYYDFGTVGLDIVEHAYEIKNTGDGPLTIAQLETSCGCTTARLKTSSGTSPAFGMNHGSLPPTNITLAPGETAEIIAAYNPLAHGPQNAAGRFRRVVYLQTDNPRGEHQLTFDVTVDPNLQAAEKSETKITEPLAWNATEHDFGSVYKENGTVIKDFFVTNTTEEAITVERIATSCSCTTAEISTETIPAGETARVTVAFDPNFHEEPQGKLTRTVTLFTDSAEAPEAQLTIYAEIME